MSLLDSIERLQRAPVHKRKTILVFSVIIGMLLILGIWFLQIQNEFSPSSAGENTNSIVGPFRLVWQTLKNNIKDLGNQIKP